MHHRPGGGAASAVITGKEENALRQDPRHCLFGQKRGDMEFRPIELGMKARIERYTKPWKLQCSEYTFTNLYIWGKEANLEVAEEDGALYLLGRYGESAPFMFAPLSEDPAADYEAVIARAVKAFEARGAKPCFRAVAGPLYDAFRRVPGMVLTEDRDYSDYVYSAESLRTLAGKKLRAKRNHISHFSNLYEGRFEYVALSPDMLDECLAMYGEWLRGKDPDEPGIWGERFAIERVISGMDVLGVKGCGIRIDGKLAAFTLGEAIDDEMAVIHIEKADADIRGLYTIINRMFVEREWADKRYINREEDMGLPGLRKAKLSYCPEFMIEKYRGIFQ